MADNTYYSGDKELLYNNFFQQNSRHDTVTAATLGDLKKSVDALAAQNAAMLMRLDELEKGLNVATPPVLETKSENKPEIKKSKAKEEREKSDERWQQLKKTVYNNG